jgi:hypothetical protein
VKKSSEVNKKSLYNIETSDEVVSNVIFHPNFINLNKNSSSNKISEVFARKDSVVNSIEKIIMCIENQRTGANNSLIEEPLFALKLSLSCLSNLDISEKSDEESLQEIVEHFSYVVTILRSVQKRTEVKFMNVVVPS